MSIHFPDCNPMSITESYKGLKNIWFLLSIYNKAYSFSAIFLLALSTFQLICTDPFAFFSKDAQGFHKNIQIVVTSKDMFITLLDFFLKSGTDIIEHGFGDFFLAEKIIDCALATQTIEIPLLFEVQITFFIHNKYNNKLTIILEGHTKNKYSFIYKTNHRHNYVLIQLNNQLVFNIGVNLMNYKLMQGDNSIIWQLGNLFNSMFCRESLRKNTYLFNSLNEYMEISIKTIAKERRVAQITTDFHQITSALKQCPYVEVLSTNLMKILMKGDDVIVKLTSPEGKKILKKDVQSLTKQIRCELKENSDSFTIEFQSHAATIEFIERVKISNKQYHYEVLEKNPYRCIEESINNFKKEKKNVKQGSSYEHHQHYNNNYNTNYYAYDMSQYYSEQFPVFIRRALPSDDQDDSQTRQNANNARKYIEKGKSEVDSRPRFNSDDFPAFDKLSLAAEPKQEGA